MRLHRVLSLVLVAVWMVAAPAARAQLLSYVPFLHKDQTTTGFDHAAHFGAYRSWSWGEVHLVEPLYTPVIQAAVEKELKKRGWQQVPSGGSITVFADGDVRSEQQQEDYYTQLGGGWAPTWGLQGWGPGWAKSQYGLPTSQAMGAPGNNLVLDLFDTSTHKLVFRGVTPNDLSNTYKENVEAIRRNVKDMLKDLPKKDLPQKALQKK